MTTKDRSSRDMTWAVKLANRRYTAHQIAEALARPPGGKRRHAGSMKYQAILQTRGFNEATKYATRTAGNAVKFVTENPKILDRGAAAVRLVEIEDAVESLPWLVYCGPKARRALDAALVVAWRVGSVKFGLALREWAELSGLDFESIRTARSVLQSEGWLRRDPNDRNGRTARYSLSPPAHIHSHRGGLNVGLHDDRQWLAHDAFREPALGSLGWAVLRAVPPAPTPIAVLEGRLALDHEDLWEQLLQLERAHLILVGDNSVRRAADDLMPLLDAVAVAEGTAGELIAQRARHLQDRAAWHGRGDVNVGGRRGS